MPKQGPIVAWGISCRVKTDEQMGTVMAGLTLLGATDIAWAPIREKTTTVTKAPKDGSHESVIAEFLKGRKEFKAAELMAVLDAAGLKGSSASYFLNRLIDKKAIKRKRVGHYAVNAQ